MSKRKKPDGLTIFAAIMFVLTVGILAGTFSWYYFPPAYISPYASDTCVYARNMHWQCERPDGTRYWRIDR